MSEINSPLGKQTISSPSTRNFTIDDLSPDQIAQPTYLNKEMVQELETVKKVSREDKKRISPAAKERLEFLMNVNRMSTEVEVDKVKFTLVALTSGQMRQVLLMANANTRVETLYLLRLHVVASALSKIDDTDVNLVIGSEDYLDKLNMVESLNEELVELLHIKYNQMIAENKKKYIVTTEIEAKEVIEDIKKS